MAYQTLRFWTGGLTGLDCVTLPVMSLTVRGHLCLIATALIAIACGTGDESTTQDLTPEPVAVTAIATQTPAPTVSGVASAQSTDPTVAPETAIPTEAVKPITPPSPKPPGNNPHSEPTVNPQPSGLACYGLYISGWEDMIDPDAAMGFPTLEEAATDWWQNSSQARWWHQRDGSSSISAEDLTQSPPTSRPKARGSAASGINDDDQPQPPPTAIYYRDDRGNAQIVIYGMQLADENWVIYRGEFCSYMEN